MQLRRVAFPAFLLSLSLYILLPTADELVIHPVFGLCLSQVLNMPLVYGMLLSMAIYRGLGLACLSGSLIIGGKPIYRKLKERIRKNQSQKEEMSQTKNLVNTRAIVGFWAKGFRSNPYSYT